MTTCLTRVDREGVPCLVQKWCYVVASIFEVKLFNGKILRLDRWAVREAFFPAKLEWDADFDCEAIDYYVSRYWKILRQVT